jgi:intron-binding protein aquarius
LPMAMQKPKKSQMPLQRVVMCGDHFQNSPVIQSLAFRHFANLEQSLFSRLVRLGVPTVTLDQQGRARPSIASIYSWRYPKLGNLPEVESNPEFMRANAGFKYDYQFINVPDYKGRGEAEPTPHFVQNLGEAEYAVAIYQYMRLLGYSSHKITILTTYAGQRALIRDVLNHRCARNPIFGLPKAVATVDKYQGEQNDCELLESFQICVIKKTNQGHRCHLVTHSNVSGRLLARRASNDSRLLSSSTWPVHPRSPRSLRGLRGVATSF